MKTQLIELGGKAVVTVKWEGENLAYPDAVATFEGANYTTLAKGFINAIVGGTCGECGGIGGLHREIFVKTGQHPGGEVDGYYTDCSTGRKQKR